MTIDTLIQDVTKVLKEGKPLIPEEEVEPILEKYNRLYDDMIKYRLLSSSHKPQLRMSNLGSPCMRKLWLQIHRPECREPLSGKSKFKFFYGDSIELTALLLAELAGHRVEGCQDEVEIEGIKGHRDAVIDGVIVDIKSTSRYAFRKFKEGKLQDDDSFGYRMQLQSYMYASQDDPIVTDKTRAAFWAINRDMGDMCLLFYPYDENILWGEIVDRKRNIVNDASTVPPRPFEPVEEANGNKKLCMECSYCDVKKACWENLRAFQYSNGIVYFTHIEKTPNVKEIQI